MAQWSLIIINKVLCATRGAKIYQDYIEWKQWGEQSFAKLTPYNKAYFQAEISMLDLGKNPSVIEIGYGNGEFLSFCQENKWKVCGTEVNEGLVDIAKKFGFESYSPDQLQSISDETFDLAVGFDVLEHIPVEEHLNFLNGILSKLKNGGVLLLRFPNADSPLGLPNQYGDLTHCSHVGSGLIRSYANILRCRVLHIKGEARPITLKCKKESLVNMIYKSIFPALEIFIKKIGS